MRSTQTISTMRRPVLRPVLYPVLCLALFLPARGLLAQDENPVLGLERALRELADRTRPSVVQVTVSVEAADGKGAGGEFALHGRISLSGVITSSDGFIVSLGDAFRHASGAEVILQDGRKLEARIAGTDEETNIALLQVDAVGLPAVDLGDSDTLGPGSIVCAVGNPFGLSASVSFGTVAGVGRVVHHGPTTLSGVVQFTAPVNPGDPGGLLADSGGRMVGLLASTYHRSALDRDLVLQFQKGFERLASMLLEGRAKNGESDVPQKLLRELLEIPRKGGGMNRFGGELFGGQGLSFALPVNQVREVVARIQRGEPSRPRGYLGVRIVPLEPALRAHLGIEGEIGVLVVGVEEKGPAAGAGLREFDAIRRFGGRPVSDGAELRARVLQTAPGDTVLLDVFRQGIEIQVPVTISTYPEALGAPKTEETEKKEGTR